MTEIVTMSSEDEQDFEEQQSGSSMGANTQENSSKQPESKRRKRSTSKQPKTKRRQQSSSKQPEGERAKQSSSKQHEGERQKRSSSKQPRRERQKRSEIHDHFEINEDGKWKCNYCSALLAVMEGGTTSHCLRHLRKQHPTEARDIETETSCILSEFKIQDFQEKFVTTIVVECLPFSIAESSAVEDLLKYCNPEVIMPSRFKLKADIIAKFESEKGKLMAELQNIPGKLSCITDTWTSSNMHPYQGVIVQYISKDWELCSTVLDLTILEGSHTGANMANALIEVLEDFRIADKLIAITTDNAANNNTMMKSMSDYMKNKGLIFDVENNHVRCFAHIVNLSCGAAFDAITSNAPVEGTCIGEDNEDGNSLIAKVRCGIKAIRKSHTKRETYKNHCALRDITHNELILDVKTRWNSTYDMIKRIIKMKAPYTDTLSEDPDCSKYLISDNEFEALENIKALLKPFKTVTKDISNQNFPTISLCGLLYVELFDHLEKFFPNKSNKKKPINKDTNKLYPQWLQTAAKSAWEKLNNYYPSSDGLVYVIGSVMDPRCKLKWFSKQFPQDIINKYTKVLTTHWKNHYKQTSNEQLFDPTSPKPKNPFARHIKEVHATRIKDELEVYLSDEMSMNWNKSALDWWKLHEDEFPNLAKMARDFLCIHGSGVPVECLFSNGPDLLRNRRQSLADETIRKCICLKLWLTKSPICTYGEAAAEKMNGFDP